MPPSMDHLQLPVSKVYCVTIPYLGYLVFKHSQYRTETAIRVTSSSKRSNDNQAVSASDEDEPVASLILVHARIYGAVGSDTISDHTTIGRVLR